MPRLPRSLLQHAFAIDPLLVPLLRVTRHLQSAKNELRWLREHVGKNRAPKCLIIQHKRNYWLSPQQAIKLSRLATARNVAHRKIRVTRHAAQHGSKATKLQNFIAKRARGEPLQYILGSAFFGELEILCGPKVLIPRWETAAAVEHLVSRLLGSGPSEAQIGRRSEGWVKHGQPHVTPIQSPNGNAVTHGDSGVQPLRVLDLCTGTGCVPLLFGHEFEKQASDDQRLTCVGIDISPQAVRLACKNARLHPRNGVKQSFLQADVLAAKSSQSDSGAPSLDEALRTLGVTPGQLPQFDILISNPPYISSTSFSRTTDRSVRRYEPRLALVPPDDGHGMTFYPVLATWADKVGAKIVMLEVADLGQAIEVVEVLQRPELKAWDGIEIWRDEPANTGTIDEVSQISVDGRAIAVRGSGNGRSVVAWRGGRAQWLTLGLRT